MNQSNKIIHMKKRSTRNQKQDRKQSPQKSITIKSNRNKSSQKSKQKLCSKGNNHKKKQDKFNTVQYLNAKIDELNSNYKINNKKKVMNYSNYNVKRDVSSTLTQGTPILQKTISSTKIRSKSSISQVRKRSVNLNEVLNLQLEHFITEEDSNIISFTEITNPNQSKQPITIQEIHCPTRTPIQTHKHTLKLQYSLKQRQHAIIKIQRAWRNYQTKIMIHNYFCYYQNKNAVKAQSISPPRLNGSIEYSKDSQRKKNTSRELQRTLKIKQQQHKNQKDQNYYSTDRKGQVALLSQRYDQHKQMNQTIKLSKKNNKILKEDIFLYNSNLKQGQDIENCTSKDLNFLLNLFKSTHQLKQMELQKTINQFYQASLDSYHQIIDRTESFSSSEDTNFHQNSLENINVEGRISEKLSENVNNIQIKERDFWRRMASSSVENAQFVIFQKRQANLKVQSSLAREQASKQVNKQKKRRRIQQIQSKCQRQLHRNNMEKQSHKKSIERLRGNALAMHKQWIILQKRQSHLKELSKVRKCFSTDSLMIKCITQEIKIKDLEYAQQKDRNTKNTFHNTIFTLDIIQANQNPIQNRTSCFADEELYHWREEQDANINQAVNEVQKWKGSERVVTNSQQNNQKSNTNDMSVPSYVPTSPPSGLSFRHHNIPAQSNIAPILYLQSKQPSFQLHSNEKQGIHNKSPNINLSDSQQKSKNLHSNHSQSLEFYQFDSLKKLREEIATMEFYQNQQSQDYPSEDIHYNISNEQHCHQQIYYQKVIKTHKTQTQNTFQLNKNQTSQQNDIFQSANLQPLITVNKIIFKKQNKIQKQVCNSDQFDDEQKSKKLQNESNYFFQNDELVENKENECSAHSLSERQSEAHYSTMRKCTEELQEIIEQQLLLQFLKEIYMKNQLYKVFSIYVEQVFEFKKIPDSFILQFIQKDIKLFFQPKEALQLKVNQKINPNSMEILRLIRDFQFEIQEYELIITEDVFRAYRKHIEEQYLQKIITVKQKTNQQKIQEILHKQQISERSGTLMKERKGENLLLLELLEDRQIKMKVLSQQVQKKVKEIKYISFQRDLLIMYMKSVFNCYNELLIQEKSLYTYMSGRSSIGPGELTLAIKQYNSACHEKDVEAIFQQVEHKMLSILNNKCIIPIFKNYTQLELLQKQMLDQIKMELAECEFKWVNYMDEVLEIWQDLSLLIVDSMWKEVAQEMQSIHHQRQNHPTFTHSSEHSDQNGQRRTIV